MSEGRILIVDDEARMGELLVRSLAREGYEATSVERPQEAIDLIKGSFYDVLITDLRMPGIDGLEVLARAKRISPETEVILMTAYATVETAREALTRGAVDYLTKPVSAENDLKPLLKRLLAGNPRGDNGGAAPAPAPPARSAPQRPEPEFIVASPAMIEIVDKIGRVAQSNTTVLLRGESGTGKEVMARLIQARSPRAGKPFVAVNCGALTETLLESELFGHVRGAYTGAQSDREGLFASAHGGTVMLDEIGEVSPAMQVKLLRVLQSGEYTRVGENAPRRADVRVIAATNRNLEAMMEEGSFRQDLYYRLNVVPITLPPLRERPEDVEKLIDFFLARFDPAGRVRLLPETREALRTHPWPGNIRELENAIEHAVVLGDPAGIRAVDLPLAVQRKWQRPPAGPGGAGLAPADAASQSTLEDTEKRCLIEALRKTRGNRSRAARLLGVTRRTLGYRLRKYGLEQEADQLRDQEDDSPSA